MLRCGGIYNVYGVSCGGTWEVGIRKTCVVVPVIPLYRDRVVSVEELVEPRRLYLGALILSENWLRRMTDGPRRGGPEKMPACCLV